MKLALAIALAVAIMGNSASAQVTAGSESTSGSQSYSGINFNQSRGYKGTPSMGAPSVVGDCLGNSGAISGPGFGISLGGGNGNRSCNLRANAAMLAALAGNQVAVTHLCLNDKELARTLSAYGMCPSKAAPATSKRPAARTTAHGSVCEYAPSGALRVSIMPGYTQSQAVRSCRQALR